MSPNNNAKAGSVPPKMSDAKHPSTIKGHSVIFNFINLQNEDPVLFSISSTKLSSVVNVSIDSKDLSEFNDVWDNFIDSNVLLDSDFLSSIFCYKYKLHLVKS